MNTPSTCADSLPLSIKPRKLLIITSSGGGGLIQTANAKQQEALLKDPNLVVVRKDLLQDWVWTPFGNFCIHLWNSSQRKGNIFAQQFCIVTQSIADFFLHPIIFGYALYTIMQEDVDHVIDTQALGTSAILKALMIFNKKKGKQVCLEKVVVDLPTRKATHFFRSIKNLSSEKRKLLRLTSIAPLLEAGETEEEFWQQMCKMSAQDVNCEEPYVRQAFIPFKGKKRGQEKIALKIRYQSLSELAAIKQSFQKGSIQAQVKSDSIEFAIEPQDKVITVLLGSQPAQKATLDYVANMVEAARKHPKQKIHLFVFCANYDAGKASLFSKVASISQSEQNFPTNLSIIPFSFQKEDRIAPLFWRSDATCTRSGGQTAMELISVNTGKMWIHSEAKRGENILKGMPSWESAAAVYLQKKHGAHIVSTATIDAHLHQVFN